MQGMVCLLRAVLGVKDALEDSLLYEVPPPSLESDSDRRGKIGDEGACLLIVVVQNFRDVVVNPDDEATDLILVQTSQMVISGDLNISASKNDMASCLEIFCVLYCM